LNAKKNFDDTKILLRPFKKDLHPTAGVSNRGGFPSFQVR